MCLPPAKKSTTCVLLAAVPTPLANHKEVATTRDLEPSAHSPFIPLAFQVIPCILTVSFLRPPYHRPLRMAQMVDAAETVGPREAGEEDRPQLLAELTGARGAPETFVHCTGPTGEHERRLRIVGFCPNVDLVNLPCWDVDFKTRLVAPTTYLRGFAGYPSVLIAHEGHTGFITGHRDGMVMVWGGEREEPLSKFEAHRKSIASLLLYTEPVGEQRRLVSATSAGELAIWDDTTYALLHRLQKLTYKVNGLATFITADGHHCRWVERVPGLRLTRLHGSKGIRGGACFAHKAGVSHLMVSASELQSFFGPGCICLSLFHTHALSCCRLVAADGGGKVRVYDPEAGETLIDLTGRNVDPVFVISAFESVAADNRPFVLAVRFIVGLPLRES
jgi:hypothetical protein